MADMQITILNKLGLHARAAAKFVTLASSFDSNIELCRDNRVVNGKSIMGVMMLAASRGTELTIRASGADENDALSRLGELVTGRFGEDE